MTGRATLGLKYHIRALVEGVQAATRPTKRTGKVSINGRKIAILGNGPSAADFPYNKDYDLIICSNGIYRHPRFGDFPHEKVVYTIEDLLNYKERLDDARSLEVRAKIFPYQHQRYGIVDGGIYVPYRIYYLGFPKFKTDPDRYFYWGGAVTYFNIQLAVIAGADEIEFYGVDGYKVPTTHFRADYHREQDSWVDPKYERMLVSFRHAEIICERFGVKLKNMSPYSGEEILTN